MSNINQNNTSSFDKSFEKVEKEIEDMQVKLLELYREESEINKRIDVVKAKNISFVELLNLESRLSEVKSAIRFYEKKLY